MPTDTTTHPSRRLTPVHISPLLCCKPWYQHATTREDAAVDAGFSFLFPKTIRPAPLTFFVRHEAWPTFT